MNFERLILTESNEFYRVSFDYKSLAYIMMVDTLKPTPKAYMQAVMNEDEEPADNFIDVRVGTCKKLSEDERSKIRIFVDNLISYKPNLDYSIEFFDLKEDVYIGQATEQELHKFLSEINDAFNTSISFSFSTINNLIQK
ncbi:hypothetical protein [Amphibacillus jilinensis]|uniref:hypothetical protein n=1 Tax=Amphibacillus jilinensis TaxID=1216008 RepID=UPI0002D8E3E0|nr:hypothetical protein [Amphibacillus jilinensis]